MQDVQFRAELHSAKLIIRKDEDKRVLRRVQFSLMIGEFPIHVAEWLGDEAIAMRKLLQERSLNKFELPINYYFARATFAGTGGNADADAAGIKVVAAVVGKDEKEHEEIALTFEAFPTAKLLTWMAACMGEWIDVEMVASQRELFGRGADEAIKHAVEGFKATIPAGTTVTMTGPDGDSSTIEGGGEP